MADNSKKLLWFLVRRKGMDLDFYSKDVFLEWKFLTPAILYASRLLPLNASRDTLRFLKKCP
jgi:hypothetical protein